MVNTIIGIAYKTKINPFLLLAICHVETGIKNINNDADHSGASYGVSQIKVGTARDIMPYVDALALQQPSVNVTVSAKYLKKLIKKYNSERLASSAYNAGHIRYVNGELLNTEYVKKVAIYEKMYKKRLCLMRGKHGTSKIQKTKQQANLSQAYSMQY